MSKPWGYHAMIDVRGCNKEAITSAEVVRNFVKELVEAIDMVAYGEPLIVDFANHDPSKGGFTLVQLIETSNICAHFVSESSDAYFDVFSCKEFQVRDVLPVINKYFKPVDGFVEYFYRDAHNKFETKWQSDEEAQPE